MSKRKPKIEDDVKHLDDYKVMRLVGQGMLGKVYRAQDTRSEKTVAIKVLRTDAKEHAKRLQDEFRLLSTLRHHNLADVFDYGMTEEGNPYFAMQWIAGDHVTRDVFLGEDRKFDNKLFAEFIRQVSSALTYIRTKHLVHGDIKPENILVSVTAKTGLQATVMDFGISKSIGKSDDGLSGTLQYIAPELIQGATPGPATDLYALGCVLYEVISGAPPYSADSSIELLKQHLKGAFTPLTTETGVDEQILTWVHTLLQKDPRLRYRYPEQLYTAACTFLDLESDVELREFETFSAQLVHVPRENERSKLRELTEASESTFQCVCISGEEGSGKTTLLNDLKVTVQLDGGRVYYQQLRASTSAFQPILTLLSSSSIDTTDSGVAAAASVFRSFFPDTFAHLPADTNDELGSDAQVLRMFHASAELLVSTPFSLITLDDFHNADELTQEFFAWFIPWASASSVTGRMLALGFDDALVNREVFPEELQQSACTTLTMQPLPQDMVAKNIDTIFDGDMTPSFHSFVWKYSGGNPGKVEHILRYCVEEGIVERGRHGWILHERDDLGPSLPTSVVDRFTQVIARLSENELLLFKALALSPLPVESTALEYVSEKSIEKVYDACTSMVSKGLAEQIDGRFFRRYEQSKELLSFDNEEESRLNDRYVTYYNTISEDPPSDRIMAEHLRYSSTPQASVPYFLNASTEAEKVYDYGTTFSMLNAALDIPSGIEDDEELFRVYDSVVRVSNILGNREAESEYIEEMLILAGRWKGEEGAQHLAQAYDRRTEYYIATADFDHAKKSTERALRNYEEARDRMGTGRCRWQLGFILYKTSPNKEIINYYNEALNIFAEEKAVADEANTLIDIGLVYYSILNLPDDALRCYSEAREKFLTIGMERGAARAYGNAGVQHYALGDYEQAYEHHAKANEIFREIGDYRATAISHFNVGRCLAAMGKYIDALAELDKSLSIGKALSDKFVQENSHENLGEVYFFLGLYEQSESSFKTAKAIAEAAGNQLGEVVNNLDIAQILIERGKTDEAIAIVSKCELLLNEIKDVNVEAACQYRMGQAYLAKGKNQNHDDALQHFLQLGEIADVQGDEAFSIIARSYAALCHAHLGHPAEALALSEDAETRLAVVPFLVGGKQDIYFNHARVLRVNKHSDAAEDYIRSANDETMRIAGEITDPTMYRSFTENVQANAEIIREFSLLNRTSTPGSISVTREQNLHTLYDVSSKINSVLDLPQLLENIMDSALEAMNGERGLIFLLEDETLELKVSRKVERETIKDATEISLSILKDVVSGGKPIIIADTSEDDSVKKRESVVNYNIHSIICVPMKSKDKVIGTVYVDSRSDALSAMSFSDIDADFLEAFANLATIAIENARLHTKLQKENLYLKQEVKRQFGFENIIGGSKAMEHLFRETQSAILSDDSVLVYGASGTGKELIARAIHYNSSRKDKRFVAIDCGALQDTLLESELFGYKRGAFTGAITDKKGLFEEAHKGTLFLDEIGNTSLAFQAKLLRVLQEGDFRRVGDTETRRVDVRIIAATNTDIQKQIEDGLFRQDLYYRLNVIPLRVPNLKERTEDIALLINHFVQQFNLKNNASFKGASEELIAVLQRYDWPGNVRELENLVSRMCVLADTEMLSTGNLPSDFQSTSGAKRSPGSSGMRIPTHLKTLKDIEIEHIKIVLSHTGNNKTEAAKVLGLKRTTLVEKMKKLGIM